MRERLFLFAAAFISGMSIMAIEVTAARLLAPYFGASAFVWTNIIAVVLISLSLGYWFGGKVADKRASFSLVGKLLGLSGIICLFLPFLFNFFGLFFVNTVAGILPAAVFIFVGSLVVAVLLLGVPLVLLGMMSPLLVKLYAASNPTGVGQAAGGIFAVSTIGSILGTFMPTLVFIPWWGSRMTILLFAALLILAGVFLSKYRFNKGLVILVIILFIGNLVITIEPINTIYATESFYQFIRVNEQTDGTRMLVFNEGLGVQSIYNPDKILTGYYYDYLNILPALTDRNIRQVLIVGLAGGTISRQLLYFYPFLQIDGVEIDEKVIEVGREFFALDSQPIDIYNQDGRIFLQLNQNKKQYDLIVIDAYSQELYIPWIMTTVEFWRLVKNNLSASGVVAFNVAALPQSDLTQALAGTLRSVFPFVYLVNLPSQQYNVLLVASPQEITWQFDLPRSQREQLDLLADDFVSGIDKITTSEVVLTDDWAPVEYLTNRIIWQEVKKIFN